MPVRGVRGATTVTKNTKEEILAATTQMLTAMVEANGIHAEDIASAWLTVAISTLRCLKMRLSTTRLIASSNRRGSRVSSHSPISTSSFSGTS